MKLPLEFYQRDDVVQIARDLIGKVLCTDMDETVCKGIITETEAYNGRTDRACHAYAGRRTTRTEVMYQPGGIAYVYLCYGIHNLFNIVTNKAGAADAVLVRALKPVDGVDLMKERRQLKSATTPIAAGPGTLSKALGISRKHNAIPLNGNLVWIEEGNAMTQEKIKCGKRIGIDYAGEDANLPWRFWI